ncbi:hypothetical protein AgCh_017186 [Apium graveolens]
MQEVLVERALKETKVGGVDGKGYSIFKQIPIFMEELKARLGEEVVKARKSFENGDFTMENRVEKCRTYPIYKFVWCELGTKVLTGARKISPGEDIEKLHMRLPQARKLQIPLTPLPADYVQWNLAVFQNLLQNRQFQREITGNPPELSSWRTVPERNHSKFTGAIKLENPENAFSFYPHLCINASESLSFKRGP